MNAETYGEICGRGEPLHECLDVVGNIESEESREAAWTQHLGVDDKLQEIGAVELST